MGVSGQGFDKDALERKVASATLRDFALHGEGETLPVVIELDVPVPRVELDSRRGAGPRPARVAALSSAEQAKARAIESAARKKIPKIVAREVKWLSAAQAYLARVTPQELLKLVTLSAVRAVRLRHE